jgi:hypothetical protein
MKYFTPSEFIRLQQRAHRPQALADWERAAERYGARLSRLMPDLPTDVRRFIKAGSLHDATVLAFWMETDHLLRMLLRRDGDPESMIGLTYRLVSPPQVSMVLPEEIRTAGVSWLYDEIDIERPARNGRPKKPPVLRHTILLSDGSQLLLRFQRMRFQRFSKLVAAGLETRSA